MNTLHIIFNRLIISIVFLLSFFVATNTAQAQKFEYEWEKINQELDSGKTTSAKQLLFSLL